jgi:hypothetical protein
MNKDRFRKFFNGTHKRPAASNGNLTPRKCGCSSQSLTLINDGSPPSLDDGFNYEIEEIDEESDTSL